MPQDCGELNLSSLIELTLQAPVFDSDARLALVCLLVP